MMEKKQGWINIYQSGVASKVGLCGDVYETKQEADIVAKGIAAIAKRVACILINWDEK